MSRTLLCSLALLASVACTDSTETPPDPIGETGADTGKAPGPAEVTMLVVDATDRIEFAYVDLDTATVLGPDAASGTDWELALRRFDIRSNGGSSGTGNVSTGLAVEPAGFYDGDGEPVVEAFANADPAAQLDALTTAFDMPETRADRIPGVFAEDWFDYDFMTGIATANLDHGWLIRGGEGTSYARVRMNELDFPTREGNGIVSFTVDVEVDDGAQLSASIPFTGSVPGEGGSVCFDMDTNANVDCTGTAWDLQLGFSGRDTFLYTNSGGIGDGNGGALGPFPWTELEAYTRATESPSGQDVTMRFTADETQSAFNIESWYEYNLQNQFRLYPNFRVYVVEEGEDGPAYAVQVTDYYDDAEVAGHVALRWIEL